MGKNNKAASKNDAHHDEHRPDVGLYLKVFGALMLLTFITVAISKVHLPRPQAIGLGLAVACVKAGLVCAIFMHLKGENKLIHKALLITGACAAILILPMVDGSIIVRKVTQRMPVAEQHPAEGHGEHAAEAEHGPQSTEPIKVEVPAKAAKPAPAKKAAAKH